MSPLNRKGSDGESGAHHASADSSLAKDKSVNKSVDPEIGSTTVPATDATPLAPQGPPTHHVIDLYPKGWNDQKAVLGQGRDFKNSRSVPDFHAQVYADSKSKAPANLGNGPSAYDSSTVAKTASGTSSPGSGSPGEPHIVLWGPSELFLPHIGALFQDRRSPRPRDATPFASLGQRAASRSSILQWWLYNLEQPWSSQSPRMDRRHQG